MDQGSSGLSPGPKSVVGSIVPPILLHRASAQGMWRLHWKGAPLLCPRSQPPVRTLSSHRLARPLLTSPCRHRDLSDDRTRHFTSWVYRISRLSEKLARSCRPFTEKDGGKSLTGRRGTYASGTCHSLLRVTEGRWPSWGTSFQHA